MHKRQSTIFERRKQLQKQRFCELLLFLLLLILVSAAGIYLGLHLKD